MMKEIGAVVVQFHATCKRLYESSVSESMRRAKVAADVQARSQHGDWGVTQADTAAEQQRRNDFVHGVVQPMARDLEKFARAFGVCRKPPPRSTP